MQAGDDHPLLSDTDLRDDPRVRALAVEKGVAVEAVIGAVYGGSSLHQIRTAAREVLAGCWRGSRHIKAEPVEPKHEPVKFEPVRMGNMQHGSRRS